MTVIAAAAVMVSACAPDAPPTPSPEPVVTSVAPSPSATPSGTPTPDIPPPPDPTPTPSSTLNEEQAEAVATVLEFFRLKNELSKDPSLELEPLANITIGETSTIQISMIDEYRENRHVQTGDTVYHVTKVGSLVTREGGEVMALGACTDTRNVDLVSQDTGESVLDDSRAYFVDWSIEVVQRGTEWKVGDITSDIVDKCGP